MLAQAGQIDEAIDPPQQVILRHVALQAEAVEQRLLHHRPLTHHGSPPALRRRIESEASHRRKAEFFNTIGAKRTSAHPCSP